MYNSFNVQTYKYTINLLNKDVYYKHNAKVFIYHRPTKITCM